MESVKFFGYGALKSRQVMTAILGHDPGEGQSAFIQGFQLAYQTLEDIPASVRPTLQNVWGDGFRAYTVRRGTGVVVGVIWELTQEDLQKIASWEMVGPWREMVESSITAGSGESLVVKISKAPDNQSVTETVDGINYRININREGNLRKSVQEESDQELLEGIHHQLEELASRKLYA